MKKTMILFVLLLVLIGTSSLIFMAKEKNTEENKPLREYTVWSAYWDLDDFEGEIGLIEHKLSGISHFAAYFDHEHRLFIPKTTQDTHTKLLQNSQHKGYKNYLSFVNDIAYEDGTSELKSTDLLYELFRKDTTHIIDIITLTKEQGYDGIEIDYEGIKDNLELWDLFIAFIKELYSQSEKYNLSLRVVLEPSVPSHLIELPSGPQYVLMAYNLFGPGTQKGPKANKTFLIKMIEKKEEIPGDLNVALSLGGFDFAANHQVKAVNEQSAQALLQTHNAKAKRDKESQALVFSYLDIEMIEHEVWFADATTINYWMSILEAGGIDKFSFWKLGGNLKMDMILK